MISQNENGDDGIKYLFIPLESISLVKFKDQRVIWDPDEFDQFLPNFNWNVITENSGLLVPLKDLHQTDILAFNSIFLDCFEESKNILSELTKAKQVSWKVNFLKYLKVLKELIPSQYSRVNYHFYQKNNKNFK